MKTQSIDPRINRADLPEDAGKFLPEETHQQWHTFEVFHQKSRGEHHIHVGSVHAPNAEMAILFAKEQYARRMKCANIWVVKTSDIHATEYQDEDMFLPATDKSYREAYGYRVREIIETFKAEENITISGRKRNIKRNTKP